MSYWEHKDPDCSCCLDDGLVYRLDGAGNPVARPCWRCQTRVKRGADGKPVRDGMGALEYEPVPMPHDAEMYTDGRTAYATKQRIYDRQREEADRETTG